MAEYRWVSLPTVGKEIRSERRDDYINAELERDWTSQGWEPVAVQAPSHIGPVGFLLKREA
jgi:hypothetical protein